MIRLVKVAKVMDVPEVPEGFTMINTLSWFPNNTLTIGGRLIRAYELTPYYLKDGEGCLFENVYQSAKVYKKVSAQHQVYNGRVTWSHPEETHIDEEGNIMPAYWQWRHKLQHNPYPVRYPNGFQGRHQCLCALWQDANNQWQFLNYIQGRKKIYCQLYADLVQTTNAFQQLRVLHEEGINLLFIDVDVPPQPTLVTEDTYKQYLNDTTIAFGHTHTLGCCVLGREWWK